MPFDISLKISERILERLDSLGPDLRAALAEEFTPIAVGMTRAARGAAQAHIRYLGTKPGAYLASIQGGVASKESKVVGYVRSGSPLAHLMEGGVGPHRIAAKNARALSWMGASGRVFAKLVNDPGAAAFPALAPAFDDARADIDQAIARATAKVRTK
jgi:hypothetical protein